VTGFPNIRFYAAYPLSTKEGFKLGTLCVLDTQPKTLSPIQQQALRVLAQQVMAQIELRGKLRELATAVQEKECIARELQISEERFRAFMDASPAAAFIKDEDGHIVYCNPAMTGRFGATPEEWHGKTDHQLWPKHYAEQFRQADVNVLEGDKVQHFDEHSPSPEGGTMSWSVYKFPFVDASGRRFLAGMALDVTEDRAAARELRRYQQELQEANRKLRALSLTDPLTGLRNRRGFEDHLESEFARARRSRAPLSLFMLDIDDFKKYNDTFGRVQGDEVLRRVAGLLQHYTRTGDLVARYGGEEFVAILPDTTEMEAAQIAERLCDAISTAPWHLRQVTVSIGVGNLHSLTLTPFDFVHSVDEALYAAKHNGKNQVCQAITKPDSRSVYILPTRKEGCLLGG